MNSKDALKALNDAGSLKSRIKIFQKAVNKAFQKFQDGALKGESLKSNWSTSASPDTNHIDGKALIFSREVAGKMSRTMAIDLTDGYVYQLDYRGRVNGPPHCKVTNPESTWRRFLLSVESGNI